MNWGTESWGIVALGGVATLIASIFYMWGGTEGFAKWWRRFVGAFLLAASMNVIGVLVGNWHWQFLLSIPFISMGMSLGYGGDSVGIKVFKRTVFALGVLMGCAAGLWGVGFSVSGWIVMGIATLIGLTSVVLGVWNPFNNAPLEQYLICQVLCLFVPFWAFVKA